MVGPGSINFDIDMQKVIYVVISSEATDVIELHVENKLSDSHWFRCVQQTDRRNDVSPNILAILFLMHRSRCYVPLTTR